MERKLIFLDIDGTLVDAFASPSKRVAEALQKAREHGHLLFLCTGRSMPIISSDILDLGFDGVIASAGGHIEVGGQVVFDSILPEETIQECLSVFHANGAYCRIETTEGIYADSKMEELLKNAEPDPANSELIRMQKELETGIRIRRYEDYPCQGAYKICFTSSELSSIEETKRSLGDRFKYAIYPFSEHTTCINGEIIPNGVDKGKGIELVCQQFGASIKDTIAFGDSMNDYEMMETAGISVAMGNACEELKSVADVVCGTVKEDGVYYEFQRMGLI